MFGSLCALLVAVNALTIVRFGIDKNYARTGLRRVPERDLLTLAFIGGSPGAFIARRLFRHKTRKEPFCTHLWNIAVVQVLAIGAMAGFLLAG